MKHPVHVMVFRVVSIDDDGMSPFIYRHGFRLNIEAYIKYLKEVALTWIKRVAAGRFYI